ncbi:MAG: PD40 domain-containing protein [Anaerolineaceae bacterium]|nr:PD40 domain-containing protein [Anaerolineaceae bacterium]
MSKLERVLDDCIAQLASGQSTVEQCLADHPEHAKDLQRLLLTAQILEPGQSSEPTPIFRAKARSQLLAHMQVNPKRKRAATFGPGWVSLLIGRSFNLAFGLAAVLVLFLSTGTVLAQSALPGEALYDWKLASERVLRTLHPNPLSVDLMVAERRVNDLTQVSGNDEAVALVLSEYHQSLLNLSDYHSLESWQIILDALMRQKTELDQAKIDVPELDQLLAKSEPKPTTPARPEPVELAFSYQTVNIDGRTITYQATLTNTTSSQPISATLVASLSAKEVFVSDNGAGCTLNDGELSCRVNDLALNTGRSVMVTTQAVPCYTGMVVNTATLAIDDPSGQISPTDLINAQNDINSQFPNPARVVYVQSNPQNSDLGLVTSAGTSINAEFHHWAAAPAWSPDGKQLAFFGVQGISQLAAPYNQGNGVWVVDVINNQQQNPRQLLAQDHIKNLTWSPDGTMIAVEIGPPGITHEIAIIDAKDGRQLYRFAGEQPAWSPNSQQLIVKGCFDACGLWLVELDGSRIRQITTDSTDSYPAWSAVGDQLAFSSSNRDGNWEIYLLQMESGGITRLTYRDGTDTTPVFGPCGQDLYLRTDEYGSWWITAMLLDGSNEYKVQEGVGSTEEWGLARPAIR